jgi:error-prone DNA polymerase
MGFYSPQSLIADARRHGVTVRGPDVNASLAQATLEPVEPGQPPPAGAIGPPRPGSPPELSSAIRLGLGSVRHICDKVAEGIACERLQNGPYSSMVDLTRRVGLTVRQAEAFATAGAFGCFGVDRRQALWAAGAAAQERAGRLPGLVVGVDAPELPGMSDLELAIADVWATGVSPDSFPTQFIRGYLDERGVIPADRLVKVESGKRVLVGGAVTHRQRPATAGGVTFLNLEDETGMINVVCSVGVWARYSKVARISPAMLVRGRVERTEEVVTLVADKLEALDIQVASRSRDFR